MVYYNHQKNGGKQNYNALYHAVFASSSSVAEKVKEIISNRNCDTNLVSEETESDDTIEIVKLQNEEYGTELAVGSKYSFRKGISENKGGAYYLCLDGNQVKEMAVPIAYGYDADKNRYAIFKIAGIDDPVAFKQI